MGALRVRASSVRALGDYFEAVFIRRRLVRLRGRVVFKMTLCRDNRHFPTVCLLGRRAAGLRFRWAHFLVNTWLWLAQTLASLGVARSHYVIIMRRP